MSLDPLNKNAFLPMLEFQLHNDQKSYSDSDLVKIKEIFEIDKNENLKGLTVRNYNKLKEYIVPALINKVTTKLNHTKTANEFENCNFK